MKSTIGQFLQTALGMLVPILLVLYIGCSPSGGNSALDKEEEKLLAEIRKGQFIAPTRIAVERRIDDIHQKTKKWPNSNADFFKDGPLQVEFGEKGRKSKIVWDSSTLSVTLKDWEKGRPVYLLRFRGLVQELVM